MRTATSFISGLLLAACLSQTVLPAQEAPPKTGQSPSDWRPLFNGRDLSGLFTWLKDTGRDDPKGVFSVKDGILHVSGEGMGYVATDKVWITPEAPLPEAMTQDDYSIATGATVLFG